MIKTYRYRLKSKNLSYLDRAASSVNFVWNYCNQASMEYLDKHCKWLSKYDTERLIPGCSKELGIHSGTVQLVADQYHSSRQKSKKRKLSWRSKARSNGWIPFRGYTVRVKGDTLTYNGKSFRIWLSRPVPADIRCGQFICDSKGNWFVSLICEVNNSALLKSTYEIGIDLGLKTIATLSNGEKLTRNNITRKYAQKLSVAQRAKKKKQAASLHLKIKNTRKDWNHKQTTRLVNSFSRIVVGNVSPSKLKKTRMAKSVSDAGWADFKSMLAYKAIALGVEYKEINEMFSTVTCSACLQRTGPSGLSSVGIREWTCKCGVSHNRDVNAAMNILRFGHESPKGAINNGYAEQLNR